MNLTQPALSRQISLLERELSAQLFERQNKGIRLTIQGETFLEYASPLMDQMKAALESLNESDDSLRGEYSISTGGTVAAFVLPGTLHAIRNNNPDLRFRIYEGDSLQTTDALLHGEVDLGIIPGDIPGADLVSRPFFTDTLIPVVSETHPLAKKRNLSMEDLAGYEFVSFHKNSSIYQAMEKVIHKNFSGFTYTTAMELRSLESILRSVEAGLGIGFVSRLCLQSTKLKALKIPGFEARRDFHFFYRSSKRKGLNTLIDLLHGTAFHTQVDKPFTV